ncbi:hypothetical protein [Microbacterium telephonicum]|uniref:Ribbon-helix-helix CopG family protein n=1 Tax=Microbacterium telephonicum TaxID=1714841 RepID=A0A498C496_9MICO|nr:hypothetical protein [Microbacterium telephonicum]RLK47638.1 hypothetical protein C7474_2233 [Microbacterium telephonicum]
MKVTVDLDPKDVWRIQDRAEREGITPGQALRNELAPRRTTLEYRDRVRARVLAGLCDADIATELNRTPGEIARVRRGEGLPANPRYRNRKATA